MPAMVRQLVDPIHALHYMVGYEEEIISFM